MNLLPENFNCQSVEWLVNFIYNICMQNTIFFPMQIQFCFYQMKDIYNHIFLNDDLQFSSTNFFIKRAILIIENNKALIIDNVIFPNFHQKKQTQSFKSVYSFNPMNS